MPALPRPALVRYLAAAISVGAAIVYGLIAADVVTVVEDQGSEAPVPPVVAAVLLVTVAALLVRSGRRRVLLGGIVVQVFLIVVYFLVAIERVPAFEAWGVGLKLAQGVVLASLTWLLVSRSALGEGRHT